MATTREQLEKIDEKLAILNARKRELEAKERDKARKARTKRLIEVGASLESALGVEIPKEKLPALINIINANKEIFKKALGFTEADGNDY